MRQLNKQRRPRVTKDGYVWLIVYTDKHWDTFLTLIGREDLKADPRFRDIGTRTQHAEAIYAIIDAHHDDACGPRAAAAPQRGQRPDAREPSEARLTAPWKLHLTLHFLGDVPIAPVHRSRPAHRAANAYALAASEGGRYRVLCRYPST